MTCISGMSCKSLYPSALKFYKFMVVSGPKIVWIRMWDSFVLAPTLTTDIAKNVFCLVTEFDFLKSPVSYTSHLFVQLSFNFQLSAKISRYPTYRGYKFFTTPHSMHLIHCQYLHALGLCTGTSSYVARSSWIELNAINEVDHTYLRLHWLQWANVWSLTPVFKLFLVHCKLNQKRRQNFQSAKESALRTFPFSSHTLRAFRFP